MVHKPKQNGKILLKEFFFVWYVEKTIAIFLQTILKNTEKSEERKIHEKYMGNKMLLRNFNKTQYFNEIQGNYLAQKLDKILKKEHKNFKKIVQNLL